jgi:hypothetical protein
VAELEAVASIRDPMERAKRATDLVQDHQDAVAELSLIRRAAINELVASGVTHKEIAENLGVERARIGQLLSSGPKPERALLASGPVTIAVGGKTEGPRRNPSVVSSAEATEARDRIADCCRNHGLEVAHREIVAPPGMVNLNRSNLIVIGSPRLLPFVSQVLEADRNLGFGHGAQGWYLTEGDTIHRSPSDVGDHHHADYAYIGRLPRPDSKGTFLYLAGIHAMGTLGAATYLTENVEALYREVKNRRWSVLVECQYDPDTRAIQLIQPITAIHKV